jgi:hypothetical protein
MRGAAVAAAGSTTAEAEAGAGSRTGSFDYTVEKSFFSNPTLRY